MGRKTSGELGNHTRCDHIITLDCFANPFCYRISKGRSGCLCHLDAIVLDGNLF